MCPGHTCPFTYNACIGKHSVGVSSDGIEIDPMGQTKLFRSAAKPVRYFPCLIRVVAYMYEMFFFLLYCTSTGRCTLIF